LTLLSNVRASTTSEGKALAVLALAKWLATKTGTKLDDDLLAWLGVALALPEAAVLLRWVEHLGTVVAFEPPPATENTK
jgi:hypothetical protein